MKVPVSWLNDYVQVDDVSVEELANKLVNIGFEVEDILYCGEGIENVVVGKILDMNKHPDANKLQICMVDVGKEITTVITGANNISVGDFVPVALDGATLPGGKKILSSPLRGIMSYGMMCSGKELGVDNTVIEGAEADGILILPDSFEIGQDIKTVLGLDEYVLDISVTANRADCQSVFGIAREVGAVLNRKVKAPVLKYKSSPAPVKIPDVAIENFDLCSRYTARLITDVKIQPSPKWMQNRLRMAGIRPINNLVDITNYVLTEIGQPLHAFDLTNVEERIVVRSACANEKIIALDGKEYALDDSMLIIADKNKPLAIAGVMGGELSGVTQETSQVLLEAARFARSSIRATSRALGLRSDSSARYERGVDWNSIDMGRERALALIYQLKAGKIADASAQCEQKAPALKTITTSAEQISKLLGIEIKAASIVKILKALGFGVEQKDKNLTVTVPLFREDVENFTDLTEEVIRYYGYDNIQSTFLKNAAPTIGGLNVEQQNINSLKELLCGYGLYEVATYAFINKKQNDWLLLDSSSPLRNTIEIKNPLSVEYASMRTQLVGSMLKIVNNNTSRKNNELRLFEIAKTFVADTLPLETLPKENETLCIALLGENSDFYTLKEILSNILAKHSVSYTLDYSKQPFLHPGISADILTEYGSIGSFGKLHPDVAKNFSVPQNVFVAELNLESFISKPLVNRQYQPLPKFPAVDRDLALIVQEEITVGSLISQIYEAGGALCTDVSLFDIYTGSQIPQGCKSVAFSIKIQSQERTLTDEEIQKVMNAIVDSVKDKFNAQLRLQ